MKKLERRQKKATTTTKVSKTTNINGIVYLFTLWIVLIIEYITEIFVRTFIWTECKQTSFLEAMAVCFLQHTSSEICWARRMATLRSMHSAEGLGIFCKAFCSTRAWSCVVWLIYERKNEKELSCFIQMSMPRLMPWIIIYRFKSDARANKQF